MQRRHFMKLTGLLATLPAIKGIAATSEKTAPSGKQLYEWRIYTLEETRAAWTTFSATH